VTVWGRIAAGSAMSAKFNLRGGKQERSKAVYELENIKLKIATEILPRTKLYRV